MKAGPVAIALIKHFESCRLKAYPDAKGVWTIGWGATGKDIGPGLIWTQEQADQRFMSDISVRESQLEKFLVGIPTLPREFGAMLSLGYNIGMPTLRTSSILKRHKAGDKAGAAAAFSLYRLSGGKVLAGLVRRRKAESSLYRGDFLGPDGLYAQIGYRP